MREIRVSAPGKLILYGEHAVLHGAPCIVTAVDLRIRAKIKKTEGNDLVVEAEALSTPYQKKISELGRNRPPKEVQFVETAVYLFYRKYNISQGLGIKTEADFSSSYGLGSSSAVSACVVYGLSCLFDIKIDKRELFNLCLQTVLDVQGKGSGFDVAASVYGETLFFRAGGEVIEDLQTEEIPLVVGWSGKKADTVSVIDRVEKQKENHPEKINNIYSQIGKLVSRAKSEISASNWKKAGKLMDRNQEYLDKLSVSTKKLNRMIKNAREAGAYGAKLSGAGGGDCMIALYGGQGRNQIEKAIERAGGQIISIDTGAQGVREEA